MIMSMYKRICITNRKLCKDDFIERLKRLSLDDSIEYFVLREKDLSLKEYISLANEVKPILQDKLILHSNFEACKELNINRLHLPLYKLIENPDIKQNTSLLGVSVHSVDEALKAQNLGADYIIAGHIFNTACKPDLPARGLEFLQNICQNVNIPVYAIGGITPQNEHLVLNTGASGVCMMQYFMIL